jgi:hypothetical protein
VVAVHIAEAQVRPLKIGGLNRESRRRARPLCSGQPTGMVSRAAAHDWLKLRLTLPQNDLMQTGPVQQSRDLHGPSRQAETGYDAAPPRCGMRVREAPAWGAFRVVRRLASSRLRGPRRQHTRAGGSPHWRPSLPLAKQCRSAKTATSRRVPRV